MSKWGRLAPPSDLALSSDPNVKKSFFFLLFLLIEAFPGIVTYFFILVLKSMTLIKTKYGI